MAGMVWRAGSRARPAVGVVVRGRVAVRLREGVSVGEVAARFGVSDRTVRRIRDEDALVRGRGGCSGFRLSYVERVQIQMRCEAGESVRGIARGVERPASTVWRELARNGGRERYRALRAEARAWERARRPKACKVDRLPGLWAVVKARLRARWSPEQIAAALKLEYPDDRGMQISHESIYRALYVQSRGVLRRELTDLLRTRRSARKTQGRTELRGRIVGMVPIAERPPEADDRRVPGHWEGDLIGWCGWRVGGGGAGGAAHSLRAVGRAPGQNDRACDRRAAGSDPAPARASGQVADVGPGPRAGRARTVHRADRGAGVLLRSALAVAAREQREHQRAAA